MKNILSHKEKKLFKNNNNNNQKNNQIKIKKLI